VPLAAWLTGWVGDGKMRKIHRKEKWPDVDVPEYSLSLFDVYFLRGLFDVCLSISVSTKRFIYLV
jgi:hypothetical protein